MSEIPKLTVYTLSDIQDEAGPGAGGGGGIDYFPAIRYLLSLGIKI